MVRRTVLATLKQLRDESLDPHGMLRIIVHVVGLTPLYAPIYMCLAGLVEQCKAENNGESWISIEFEHAPGDAAVFQSLWSRGIWSLKSGNCIHIGVSEVPSEDRDRYGTELIERVFITRLPLWGLALTNNPKVNELVAAARRNTLLDFWRLFSGKLSLLTSADWLKEFESPKNILVSLYGEGTTVRRAFVSTLQEAMSRQRIVVDHGKYLRTVDYDQEFDLLMKGEVDVALTAQPWRGLRQAEKAYRSLEVVYAHLGRPSSVSSIYVRANSSKDFGFWRSFVRSLGLLVEEHIAALYEGSAEELKSAFSSFASMADLHLHSGYRETEEDFGYAMRLANDSRIYAIDIEADSSRTSRLAAADLQRSAQLYFDEAGERDPVYRLGILTSAFRRNGENWHLARKLSEYESLGIAELAPAPALFRQYASAWGVKRFSVENELVDIRKHWCQRMVANIFPSIIKVFESERNVAAVRCKGQPWRVQVELGTIPDVLEGSDRVELDFSPWVHTEALQQGLMHFNSEFSKGALIPCGINAGVIHRKEDILFYPGGGISCEGISWVWIEYKSRNGGPTPRNHFMHSDQHIGRSFLDCWHVNIEDQSPVGKVFPSRGHGELKLDVQGAVAFVCRHGREVPIAGRMESPQGMLFTFRTVGAMP